MAINNPQQQGANPNQGIPPTKYVSGNNPMVREGNSSSIGLQPGFENNLHVGENGDLYVDYMEARLQGGYSNIGLQWNVDLASEALGKPINVSMMPDSKDRFYAMMNDKYQLAAIPEYEPELHPLTGQPTGNMKPNSTRQMLIEDIDNKYQTLESEMVSYSETQYFKYTNDLIRYALGDKNGVWNLKVFNTDINGDMNRFSFHSAGNTNDFAEEKTAEQEAYRLGKYYDKTEGAWKDFDDSTWDFWRKASMMGFEGLKGGLAIPNALVGGNINRAINWAQEQIGIPKAMALNYDENNQPIIVQDYVTNFEKTDQLISVFGPQMYKGDNVWAGLTQFNANMMAVPGMLNQYMWDVDGALGGYDATQYTDYRSALGAQNIASTTKQKLPAYTSEHPWSGGYWAYLAASVLPQTAFTIVSAGLGAPMQVSMMAMTLGGVAGYNEDMRNSGVSREHALWALPVFGGAMYFTENLGGNILYRSINDIKLKGGVPAVMNDLLSGTGQKITNASTNRAMAAWRNLYNGNATTVIGRMAQAGFEEGVIEELPQGMIEQGMKIINDALYMNEHAVGPVNGMIYDEGMFNAYTDLDENSMVSQHLMDGWKESIATGFMGGTSGVVLQTIISKFKKQPLSQHRVADYYASGKLEMLENYNKYAVENNLYAPKNRAVDGTIIAVGENKMSQNEYTGRLIQEQLDMWKQVHNEFLTPDISRMSAFNPDIIKEGMLAATQLKDLQMQLQELEIKPETEITPEDRIKIEVLKTDIGKAESNLKIWTQPDEKANNGRSLGYNMRLRESINDYGTISNRASEIYEKVYKKKADEKNRQSKEYTRIFVDELNYTLRGAAKVSMALTNNHDANVNAFKTYLQQRIKANAEYTVSNMGKINEGLQGALNALKDGNVSIDEFHTIMGDVNSSLKMLNDNRNDYNAVSAYQGFEEIAEGAMSALAQYEKSYSEIAKVIPQLSATATSTISPFQTADGKEQTYGDYINNSSIYPVGDQNFDNVLSLMNQGDVINNKVNSDVDLNNDASVNEIMGKKVNDDYSKYSDDELHYFAKTLLVLHQMEDAMKNNFDGYSVTIKDEKGDDLSVELTPNMVHMLIGKIRGDNGELNLMSRIGSYDIAMTAWNEKHPDDAALYDHSITQKQYDEIFNNNSNLRDIEDRLNIISEEASKKIGVDDDVINSTFHVRMRMLGLRFMFSDYWDPTNKSETAIATAVRDAISNDKDTDRIFGYMKAITIYDQKQNGEYANKYDLSFKQVNNPDSLKTKEELAKTVELDKMLIEIESFMHKHRDVFFEQKNIEKLTTTYYSNTAFAGAIDSVTAIRVIEAMRDNQTPLGYTGYSFVSEAGYGQGDNAISSADFLRKAVCTNISGQADILADASHNAKIQKQNSTVEIPYEKMSGFKYKYFVNHMATIYGTDVNESYKSYNANIMSFLNNNSSTYHTYEQFQATSFNNSMQNGGLVFFQNFIDSENKVVSGLLDSIATMAGGNYQSWADDRKIFVNRGFVNNAWCASGDFSTGKTMVLIVEAIKNKFAEEIKSGKSFNVTLVTNTDNLRDEIVASLRSNDSLKNMNLQTLNTRVILRDPNSINSEFVIWDESSLIPDSVFTGNALDAGIHTMQQIVGNRQMMMLGDTSQMTDSKAQSKPLVFESMPISMPLNRRFATKYRILSDIADTFRGRISNNLQSSKNLPGYVSKKLSDSNTVIGSRYVNPGIDGMNKIVQSFMTDNYDGTSILILKSRGEFLTNPAFAMLRNDDGSVKPEYRNKIYVMQENIIELVSDGKPVSVQGLRASNVYIAIDHITESDNSNMGKANANRMMYTAVGRSDNYVMLIDNDSNVAADDSKLAKIAPKMDRDTATIMLNYIKAITSSSTTAAPGPVTSASAPSNYIAAISKKIQDAKNAASSLDGIDDNGNIVKMYYDKKNNKFYYNAVPVSGELNWDEEAGQTYIEDSVVGAFLSAFESRVGVSPAPNNSTSPNVASDDLDGTAQARHSIEADGDTLHVGMRLKDGSEISSIVSTDKGVSVTVNQLDGRAMEESPSNVRQRGLFDTLDDNNDRTDDIRINSNNRTKISKQVTTPMYCYLSPIRTNTYLESAADAEMITNTARTLRMIVLKQFSSNVSPSLVLKTNYHAHGSKAAWTYAFVIESGMNDDDIHRIIQTIAMVSKDNLNFNNSINEIMATRDTMPGRYEVLFNAVKELSVIETLKLQNKDNNDLYDSYGNLIHATAADMISNIDLNAFETTDATPQTYTNFINAVYSSLPSKIDVNNNIDIPINVNIAIDSDHISNNHGLQKTGKIISLREFIENTSKRFFYPDRTMIPKRNSKSNIQHTAVVLKSAYGTSVEVFVKKNRAGEGNYYQTMQGELEQFIDNITVNGEYESLKQYYTAYQKLEIVRLIMENSSEMYNVDASGKFVPKKKYSKLLNMFAKDGKYANVKRSTIIDKKMVQTEELKVLRAINTELKNTATKKALSTLYQPVSFSTISNTIVNDNLDNYNVNVDNVNMPGMYVSIDPAVSSSRGSINGIIPGMFGQNIATYKKVADKSNHRAKVSEFQEYWSKVIGSNYNDVMTFAPKNGLIYNGHALYGAYANRHLYYEMDENGKIEWSAPRHEVFHWVYREIIGEDIKTTILNEARDMMKRENPYLSQEDLAESKVEEWMSRKYGGWKARKRNTRVGNLIERLFKFVERLIFTLESPHIAKLFNNIESGKFKDQFTPGPVSTNEDGDIELIGDNVATSVQENEDQSREVSVKEKRSKTKRYIIDALKGDTSAYNAQKKMLVKTVFDRTFFNGGTMSFHDAMTDVVQQYSDIAKNLQNYKFNINNEIYVLGGKGKKLTPSIAANFYGVQGAYITMVQDGENIMIPSVSTPGSNQLSFSDIWGVYTIASNISFVLGSSFDNAYNIKVKKGVAKVVNRWNIANSQSSIDNAYDAIFEKWLGAIANPTAKDSVVGYAEMKRTIGELAWDAQELYYSKSTHATISAAFVEALNDRISQDYLAQRASDNAYALKTSLNQLKKSINNNSLSQDARNEALGMYNRFFSLMKSTARQNLIKVRYENGKIQKIRMFVSAAEEIKYTMARNVDDACFGSEAGIKEHIADIFTYRDGVKPMYEITPDGMYFNGANDPMQIISYVNGKVTFTPDAIQNPGLIYKVTDAIGLSIPDEAKKAMFPDKKGIENKVMKLISKYVKPSAMVGMTTNEFFALQIFAVMHSVNQWAQYTKLMNKDIDYGERNKDALPESVKTEIEAKHKLYQDAVTEDFVVGRLNVNADEVIKKAFDTIYKDDKMDILAKRYSVEDDRVYVEKVDENGEPIPVREYYKPSDFFALFSIFGNITQYNNATETKARTYNDNRKAFPIMALHSKLTKLFNSGNVNATTIFDRNFNEKINPIIKVIQQKLDANDINGVTAYIESTGINNGDNVSLKIVNGNVEMTIHNPIYGKRGILPQSAKLITSAKDQSVIEEMHPADLIMLTVDSYVDSMMNYNRTGTMLNHGFNMPIVNISDRLDYYDVQYGSNENYVTMSKDKEGYKVAYDKKAVLNTLFDHMSFYNHMSNQSVRRWIKVANKLDNTLKLNSSDLSGAKTKIDKLFENDFFNSAQARKIIKAELQSNKDYFLKGNVVTMGNAYNFSLPVFNKENYDLLKGMMYDVNNNNNTLDKHFDTFRRMIHNEYVNTSKVFSSVGFNNANKYKSVGYEGAYPYYTLNADKSIQYNEVMYSMFLMDMLSRPMLDNVMMGGMYAFKNNAELSKRLRVITTGSIEPNIAMNNDMELHGMMREQFNVLSIEDISKKVKLSTRDKETLVNVTDGMGFGSLVAESYFRTSFGGFVAPYGFGSKKPVIINDDILTGNITQVKYSQLDASAQLFQRSRFHRSMEKVMLDTWSDIVNEKEMGPSGYAKIDLWRVFNDAYMRTDDPNKAVAELKEYIRSSGHANVIERHMVAMILPQDTIKSVSTAIINSDPTNLEKAIKGYDKTPYITFDSKNYGMITNLSYNPLDGLERNVALPNQLISISSQFDTKTKSYSSKIRNAIEALEDAGLREIRKDKERIKDPGKVKYGTKEVQQMLAFMRQLAFESVDAIESQSTLADYVSRKDLDLNNPSIQEELQRIYRSYINNKTIQPRVNGGGFTVCDGSLIEYFKDSYGVIRNLRQLEKDYDIRIADKMIVNDKLTIKVNEKDIVFDIITPKMMHWVGDKMVPQTIVCANPVINEYKMTTEEDVYDVYSLSYKSATVNYMGDSNEDRVSEITSNVIKHFTTNKGMLIGIEHSIANRIEQSDIIFRVIQPVLKEAAAYYESPNRTTQKDAAMESDIKDAVEKYFNDFEYAINDVVAIRKPFGHAGQGAISKIIGFINDTDNNVYKDMSSAEVSDEDSDGDQTYLQFRSIKEYEDPIDSQWQEANNALIAAITSAYADKENREKIDLSSEVKPIETAIVDQSTFQEITPYTSGIASQIQSYNIAKTGKRAIGIAAANVSTYGELSSLSATYLKEYVNNPLISNILTKKFGHLMSRNLGDWLQVVLNNTKTQALGYLNIPDIAVPVLMAYLISYDGSANTMDELNSDIIAFFNTRIVRSTLVNIANEGRMSESTPYVDLVWAINEVYLYSQAQNVGISTLQYEDAKKIIDAKTDLLAKGYTELRNSLKQTGDGLLFSILKSSTIGPLISHIEAIGTITGEAKGYRGKEKKQFIREKLNSIDDEELEIINKDAIAKVLNSYGERFDAKMLAGLEKYCNNVKNTNVEMSNAKKIVKKYEDFQVITKLRSLAIRGESMRRLSTVISLRNGIETKTTELEKTRDNMELGFGQTLEDLLSGKYQNESTEDMVKRSLNFFRTKSTRFINLDNTEDITKMLGLQEEVYRALNLSKTIIQPELSKYYKYLQIMANPYSVADDKVNDVFLREHKFFNTVKNRILSYLNIGIMNGIQKYEFEKSKNDYIIDKYYKIYPTDVKISEREIVDNGERLIVKGPVHSHLNNVNLSSLRGRQQFQKHFVAWFRQMQYISLRPVANWAVSDDQQKQMKEWAIYFRTNKFINRYTTTTKGGQYLSFDSTQSLTDDEKADLRNSFYELPLDLRRLLFNYEMVVNAMSYTKGSAYDAMPVGLYDMYSDAVAQISNDLDAMNTNDVTREQEMRIFVDNYSKKKQVLPYLGNDQSLADRSSTAVMEAKTLGLHYSGDGNNKTGNAVRGYRYVQIGEYKNKAIVQNSNNSVFKIFPYTYSGMDTSDKNIAATSRYIIVHALKSEQLADMREAKSKGKSWSADIMFQNEASYSDKIYYTTEYGDIIKMRQKFPNNKYQWTISLVTSEEKESIRENTLEYNTIEQFGNTLSVQSNIEQFVDNAIMSVQNVKNGDHIENIVTESFNRTGATPILGYFINNQGILNTDIGGMLMSGSKLGRLSNESKSDKFATDGKLGRVHQGNDSKAESYAIATSKAIVLSKGSRDIMFDSNGYTLADIQKNISDFFEMAKNNPQREYILLKGKEKTFYIKTKVIKDGKEVDALKKLSDVEIYDVVKSAYAPYVGLKNVRMTLSMAKNVNMSLFGDSAVIVAMLDKVNSTFVKDKTNC